MGVTIYREIVNRHGGSIQARNRSGGSNCSFVLRANTLRGSEVWQTNV